MISIDKSIIWFLCSPYTKYHRGLAGAYLDICRIASRIRLMHGLAIFSPICHSHGMAMHGELPPVDRDFWREFNKPFRELCGGALVATMDGWLESDGVGDEISDFECAGKPIVFVDPVTIELWPEMAANLAC